MKQVFKNIFAITLLVSAYSIDAVYGKSFFLPLTQRGTAYDLMNLEDKQNKYDMDKTYGVLKAQVEYNQNFNGSEIGRYLFFNNTNTMQFGTAATAGVDVSSINFLLQANYNGTVTINPKVQTVVGDLSFNLGLDEWVEGLYFNAHLPFAWTRHDVQLKETASTATVANLAQHTVLNTAGTVAAPYTTIAGAFKGDKVVGGILQTWKYGRVDGARDTFNVADAHLALGYNFINKDNCNLGLEVRGTLSGGNESTAAYLFEPMVGNGGRHGVGGGLQGHYKIWERDEDQYISAYVSAHVDHVFDRTMRRSYDFTDGGIGSRYLLLQKLTIGTAAVPTEVVNAINITSLRAKLNIDVLYDAKLMLSYQNGGLGLEAGYEVRGQSQENHNGWVDSIDANTWAFLGAVATNATNNNANLTTINGTSVIATAVATATNGLAASNASLNKDSALQPGSMSHNVFSAVNYTWLDSEWMPFVGLGGKAEIAGSNAALNQWGVFSSMGLCF